MNHKSLYPRPASGGLVFWTIATGGKTAALLLAGLVTGLCLAYAVYQPETRTEITKPSKVDAVPVPAIEEAMAPKVDIPLPNTAGRWDRRGGLLDQARRVEEFQDKCRIDPGALGLLPKLRAELDSTVAMGAATQAMLKLAVKDARGTTKALDDLKLSGDAQILAGLSLTCWSIAQPAEAMQWALGSSDPKLMKYAALAYWRTNREGALKYVGRMSDQQLGVFIRAVVVAKQPLVSAERWEILDAIRKLKKPLSRDADAFQFAFLNQEAETDPGRVETYLAENGMADTERSTLLPSIALGHAKGDWVAANAWLLEHQEDELDGPVTLFWRKWAEADQASFEKAMTTATPTRNLRMERVLRVVSDERDRAH